MRLLAIILSLLSMSVVAVPIKVLCAHSQHTNSFVLQENITGMLDALKSYAVISEDEYQHLLIDKSAPAKIINFYDLKIDNNLLSETAINSIKELTPNIILTFDKIALQAISAQYANTSYSIIFLGLATHEYNSELIQNIINNSSNITGVLKSDLIPESLKLFNDLVPHVNKLALVGDNSETSNLLSHAVEQNLTNDFKVVKKILTNDAKDLQTKLLALSNQDVDGVVLLSLQNLHEQQQLFPYYKFVEWYAENIFLPEVTFDKIYVGRGLLCNAYFCNYQQGYKIGTLLAKMIANQSFTLKFTDEQVEPKELINLKRAKKLKITQIDKAPNRFTFER